MDNIYVAGCTWIPFNSNGKQKEVEHDIVCIIAIV